MSAVAALAARRARQQQAQSVEVPKNISQVVTESEPLSKKPRRSLEGPEQGGTNKERAARTRTTKKEKEQSPVQITPERPTRVARAQESDPQAELEDTPKHAENEKCEILKVENAEQMNEDDVASVVGDPDEYESPAETPAELQNFPLSKARLNKSNIVYSDESTLCIRIKERTVWSENPRCSV